MNINKVQIAGNLVRDPELRTTPSGQTVAQFTIATNRVWKDKNTGEKKSAAEFVPCVAWGRTGETISQYMQKGKGIYVEGRLQTRNWEANGQKHYRTEVIVEEFQFVGGAGGQGGQAAQRPTTIDEGAPSDSYGDVPAGSVEDINVEDIPF